MNDIEKQRAKRTGNLAECVLPFDVEDAEDPHGMFVLGVEWEMVRAALNGERQFTRPVHTRNVERLRMLCDRLGRVAVFEPHAGYEGCETWTEMQVEDGDV